jgi:hypothetical protein
LFEGDAVTLINETNNYFGSLRRNIKSLATKSGYKKYFESWQPDAGSEQELVVEDLRDLFVEARIDPRIEQALPLLAKIQEQNMKQADIFETWANRLVEGTWAIPDTEEKMTQLKLFLSQPQPVGADADAATSALSDILGDDSLFDMLEELAETDPDSDARPVVKAWLDANQNYPEILAIVRELEAEPDVDQEVSMTAQDLPDQQANMREGDNLANPLEEVMSPGAMGMFPEDQDMAETSISTQVNLPKWQIGLPVFVKHLGQKGKIASLGNDSAIVDVGMRQYRVPLDGLKRYPSQGVAEGSNELYQKAIRKYAQQVANDYLGGGNDYLYGANKFDSEMFGVDPKQAQQDFKTLFAQLTKQQGVAEGSSDTVYPNAEVIKSKNGKPIGEIYQDGNSWGAFHYRADRGYDLIDSREDAIEALRDLHQETGRSRPDYTFKGVAEGQCNMTEAGENCPVHGMAECWVGEVATDPKGWKQPTGAAFESSLARIKSLALLK